MHKIFYRRTATTLFQIIYALALFSGSGFVYHSLTLANFFLIFIINLSGVTLGKLLKNQFIKPTIFLPLPAYF